MITDKKLKEILTNWDLKEPIDIKHFNYESMDNKAENTWIVNDNFIIKVTKNLLQLKQHIALSKALAKGGLQTTTPITTKDKNDFIIYGDQYFSLTNFVNGECLKTKEMYEGDYESKARYLGEIIGKLHLVLEKYDLEVDCTESNIFENTKNWPIPEVKKHMNLPNSFYDDYLENFEHLYKSLPKHVIHRDPHPGNIIMKDGKLEGFIDFDLSERNVRIFDPCYAATAILSQSFAEDDSEKLKKWVAIFKNIIIGYDEVCNLSKEERLAIPYVIYSIQLICVEYFCSNDEFPNFAKINKEMLSWLVENKDRIIII